MPNIKSIGPSFSDELRTANLIGLPFSWGTDGIIQFDPRMTQAQRDAVLAVYAAHDPTKPAPPDPFIAALDAAIAATVPPIDPRIKAILVEWRKQFRS